MLASNWSSELLGREFDFEAEESLVTDPKAIQYARDGQEIEDRWRRRIKYDLLVLKGDKTEGEAAREKLRRRYQSFAKRMHQTDADELLEMFITSILTSYDPHTSYMSPKSVENFRILMRLNLEGIGAALQMVDGYTVISKIIPGGAADKQGKLKPEDRIVSVSNDKGEMVDVIDLKLNDVVDMIRGKAGTVVKLGVLPTGSNEMKVHSITRAKIELKDSEARAEIITEGTKADGSPLQIGVIDLPSFYMDMEGARNGNDGYKSTTRDVRKILDDFTQKERGRGRPRPPPQRRRQSSRSDQPDRPVHRPRPRGPSQELDGEVEVLPDDEPGRGVERPPGGADEQVQRQCQRDPGRRHPGLSSRDSSSATRRPTGKGPSRVCSTWENGCSAFPTRRPSAR